MRPVPSFSTPVVKDVFTRRFPMGTLMQTFAKQLTVSLVAGAAILLLLVAGSCANPAAQTDGGSQPSVPGVSPAPSVVPSSEPSASPSVSPEPSPSPGASPSPAPSASPEPSPSAVPSSSPVPSGAPAPIFGFESGAPGAIPEAENSITPTLVNVLVSNEQARSGSNSVKLSDTASATVGSFRATTGSARSGSFKLSVYVPADVDGTVYVDVWAGGNAQSTNLVCDLVFAVSDKTLRYRQGSSQRTLLQSDGVTSLKWVGDAWNDLVISWTEVDSSNVVQVSLNGESAKTSTADSVAGSTPVFNIPTYLNGKTPDRIEVKYGNSSLTYLKSIYIDDLRFF